MLRKLKPLSLVLVATATFLQAQSPTPAPQPSQNPPAVASTIKANAQIVIVDVVVTDKNKNPVHNLKQSDFNVREGSTLQAITHFEEHIYPDPKAPPVEHLPPLPPGVFTNFSPDPPGDAINIILLDTLNTPLLNQADVRSQLKDYLNTAKPGVRTAIFGLTSHLLLLQGFTSNPEILKSIVNKKPGTSPLLDDPAGTGASETDLLNDITSNELIADRVIANMHQMEAGTQAFQLQLRVGYTLEAMNLLARYLSALPGRKNLIWFSGSFPISVWPDPDLQQPLSTVANFDDELRETNRLFAAAQVAVYPVNARGLFNDPAFNASDSGSAARSGTDLSGSAMVARRTRTMLKSQDNLFQQTGAENSTMIQMAEQTGGHAFMSTSNLTQAVATAVADGTNFYTLTYTPTDKAQDAKFRSIQVKLQQEGYNLAYRRGYYAVASNPAVKDNTVAQPQGTPAVKGAPAPLPRQTPCAPP
jgi:VWFA-related protein